jgi:hypothetical protein
MIILESHKISDERAQHFAWIWLRQFHNAAITAAQHARLHRVLPGYQNIKKQANQIRDCLIQAKEYYDASNVVTLATKPVLMYYCAMSLAIAEILRKNDGNVSLDRARVEHNHHGLNFKINAGKGNIGDLSVCATNLRAVPSIMINKKRDLERFGTLELWHRGAREYPVPGYFEVKMPDEGIINKIFQTILGLTDERLPCLLTSGFSFLDCIKHIPSLVFNINRHGIEPNLIRAWCTTEGD